MLADSGADAMVCDAMHHEQARALCGDTIELIPFAASQEAAIRSSLRCGRDRTASR
jgi:hypothetical protein